MRPSVGNLAVTRIPGWAPYDFQCASNTCVVS